ncbi:envelope glycoprotein L [Cercopithecine betaherpesvirus 5]|uniref:Envelope glycoprotein L n=1 Tax=Simian cytomegalovirus (strain Colburn) TaxID=50292 RepID=G8XTH0_SCMVC|nr:envelope glycoprotein L [Cercopithecine betaherpesvirus 5]AEV80462.1 envelope glycoprotein L [Cercopithecine betaherpesvirus 5]
MWTFTVSFLLTLVSASSANFDNLTCVELTRRCFAGESFTPYNDKWLHPLIDVSQNDGNISQLLRFDPSTKHASPTIPLDDTFMDYLTLLHNNPNQLRVLLALLRSDVAPTWMTLMKGYSECGDTGPVYTCINDVCRAYDLRRLTYGQSIFTENVMGFEFGDQGQFSTVLVLRNPHSKTHRPIRIPVATRAKRDGLQLFYALYNFLREFFVRHNLETSLVERLDKYYQGIPNEFKQPVVNNPALLHNGVKTVDVRQHTR